MVTAEQRRSRNAGYQARWRAKRAAEMKLRPEVVEDELTRASEACLRGAADPVSDQERITLADRLADAAMVHLRRSQALAELARRIRAAERWRAVARALPIPDG